MFIFFKLKNEYFIYSTNVIIRLVYFVQYECILDVEKWHLARSSMYYLSPSKVGTNSEFQTKIPLYK